MSWLINTLDPMVDRGGYRMHILSCGAGMQSTALALMSCEMKLRQRDSSLKWNIYPDVPIYDLIVFCDLGREPPWVYRQVEFIRQACLEAGIPFLVLNEMRLYDDYYAGFGFEHMKSIPFWTTAPDGKKGTLLRACTPVYKVKMIEQYIRTHYLDYAPGDRIRKEDKGTIAMHIGFSYEEKNRANDSKSPLFVNEYPLIKMGVERPDNYGYIKDKLGLVTKASACNICPYHTNYFFRFMREFYPEDYDDIVNMDNIIDYRQPLTPLTSKLYISRARKRIDALTDEDCGDGEFFHHEGVMVWNGF